MEIPEKSHGNLIEIPEKSHRNPIEINHDSSPQRPSGTTPTAAPKAALPAANALPAAPLGDKRQMVKHSENEHRNS